MHRASRIALGARGPRQPVLSLLLVYAALVPTVAQAAAEIIVRTRSGAEVRGTELCWQEDAACLRARHEGGAVEQRIARKDLDRVVFPEPAGDDPEAAARRLRSLLPWVRWLPDEDRSKLLGWVSALSREAPASEALAVLEELGSRWPEGQEDRRELHRLLGDVCARLHWTDRTSAAARAWCREPAPADDVGAWGWWRLAEEHWRHARIDEASWSALRPIALGAREGSAGLAECYAYAIATARRAGRASDAKTLDEERLRRGLGWPAIPELQAWKTDAHATPGAKPTPEESPAEVPKPPTPGTTELSVEKARRLTLPTHP